MITSTANPIAMVLILISTPWVPIMPRVGRASTPISVPGTWTPDPVKNGRSSRGFTILEILVVIAVISIITSTILLNTQFHRLGEHAGMLFEQVIRPMQLGIQQDRRGNDGDHGNHDQDLQDREPS